ncbi:MAG TPA: dethiobiotin synthase [Bacteroidia bacterium]|jgi:dethiobiotin synthetase|nr:dethiobiotin synthase [Bacteroidia bacterium]
MKKYFITGIGTDVGKTVVSAIICEALQADYWKPVQTGSYFSTDSDKIRKYVSNSKTVIHPESFVLKQYMSPHAAAELEGTPISIDKMVLPSTQNTLVIEGAGGIMVPLNDKEFIVDMITKFQADVVLVIQNYLGSINHSILSIDALRFRNIPVAGLVFNGPPHKLSEDIILSYSKHKLIGRINKEAVINKEVVSKYAAQFRDNL